MAEKITVEVEKITVKEVEKITVKEVEKHKHHHHTKKLKEKKVVTESGVHPFTSGTNSIYNALSGLYLDYDFSPPSSYSPVLSGTNTSWDVTTVSNVYFLGSPRDTTTPYQSSSFEYLCDYSGAISMNPYPGSNALLTMTQDINSYWLIKHFNTTSTLYLRTDSSGNLSFTSTLDDSARWTRASDGTNYKFQNKNHSSLYLQSMSNGHVAQASSYVSNNQFDWTMTAQNVVTINIDGIAGQYLAYDSGGPFLGDDNGTGVPISRIYYWVQRLAPGSASNFYFESVSQPGIYLQADGTDSIPVFNSSFEYDDQTDSSENWFLS